MEMEIQQNKLNDSVPLHENNLRTAKCWRCHEDIDKEKIIRLCLCADVTQFVHVECLEKSVNVTSIYHCRICDSSLPLKRKNKPLIKWYTNITALLNMLKGSCGPIFKMLILILFKFTLIILIGYLIASLDVSKIGKFIPLLMVVLVLVAILMCPIFHEIRMMITWIMSVREYCRKWCESNQEIKLDTGFAYQRINEEIV
ncbi:uncharacterized protein [Polyergus mexicanus]|uniref:uncharacterized protein n=1 Tax=Polyergus mexicanus TaxID=615972 RepID=UPI0038B4F5AA